MYVIWYVVLLMAGRDDMNDLLHPFQSALLCSAPLPFFIRNILIHFEWKIISYSWMNCTVHEVGGVCATYSYILLPWHKLYIEIRDLWRRGLVVIGS